MPAVRAALGPGAGMRVAHPTTHERPSPYVRGATLAWRFGPLGDWLDPERLKAARGWLGTAPAGPAIGVAAIAVASVVMMPITVIVVCGSFRWRRSGW
ncbi:MAG TPA: hypothetical protein VNO26_13025 [Candidatus Limnocylindria bacterium]|nr:hypothetical protein [Candidatus Limnocylindria bacterium]